MLVKACGGPCLLGLLLFRSFSQPFPSNTLIPLPKSHYLLISVTLFICNRHILCNDFVLLMFVLSFPIYSRYIFMPAIVCLKTTNLIVAENRLKNKVIEISHKLCYPNQHTSLTHFFSYFS